MVKLILDSRFDTAVPTCRVLLGGTGPVGKSVLEGADLAVHGAGLQVLGGAGAPGGTGDAVGAGLLGGVGHGVGVAGEGEGGGIGGGPGDGLAGRGVYAQLLAELRGGDVWGEGGDVAGVPGGVGGEAGGEGGGGHSPLEQEEEEERGHGGESRTECLGHMLAFKGGSIRRAAEKKVRK